MSWLGAWRRGRGGTPAGALPPAGPMAAAERLIREARERAAGGTGRAVTLLERIRRWERAQPRPTTRDEIDREQAALDAARWDADQERLAAELARARVWSPSWQHQAVPREDPGTFWTMRL